MTRKTLEGVGWVLIFLGVTVGLAFSLNVIPPRPDIYNPGFLEYPIQTMVHAIGGLIFMALGPFQFMPSIRNRFIRYHRWAGRIFLVACIFIGFSGLSMAFLFPYGGLNEQISVVLFASFFLFGIYKAYYHIKRHELAQHREWVIRIFALGMGIATIRLLIFLNFLLTNWKQVEVFAWTFWIGFGGTLLVGEAWVRYTRKSPKT